MNRINRNIAMTINNDDLNSESYLPDDRQTWMRNFNLKCLAISERKCSQKLDSLMELYIRKMKREMNNYGPLTATNIVHHMNKTMLIFYLFYQDINDFIEISQWTRNMVEIISLYCQLELRAGQRRGPGKKADSLACRRIMAVLWSYVKNDQECMIHVLLKMPNVGRKHKYILDPIYRKLLLNQKGKILTELEYIRNVFAFKLWKRLYGIEEKKAISEMALTELLPPKTLSKNYRNYKFLPQNIDLGDIHNVLITAKLDIYMVIKGYFDHLENPRPVVIEVIDLTSVEVQTVSNNIQPLNGDLHNSSKTVCASNIDQMDDDFLLLEETELIEIDPKEPTDIVENIETPGWCASLVERLKRTKLLESLNNEVSEFRENRQNVEVSVVNEASEVSEEKHEYLKDGEKSPRVRVFKVREDASQAEKEEEDQPQQRTRKRHASRSAKPPLKRGTMNSDFNINLTVSPAQSLLLNSSFQHHFCSDIATSRKSKCYPEQQQLQLDFSAASMSQAPMDFLPSISTIRHLTPSPLTSIEPQNASVSVMGFNPPIMTAVTPLAPPLLSSAVQDLSHASSVPNPEMAPPILSTEVPCWYEIKASKPKLSDYSQASCFNIMTTPLSPPLSPVMKDLSQASLVLKPEVTPPIPPTEVQASKPKVFDPFQTFVNINGASCNSTDDEIHLPLKKRRISSMSASMSSLKVEIEDKLSYPATPMLSIAELITSENEMGRPFRTLAERKDFPRISDPYRNPIVPDPLQSNESKSFPNSQDLATFRRRMIIRSIMLREWLQRNPNRNYPKNQIYSYL